MVLIIRRIGIYKFYDSFALHRRFVPPVAHRALNSQNTPSTDLQTADNANSSIESRSRSGPPLDCHSSVLITTFDWTRTCNSYGAGDLQTLETDFEK